MQVPDGYHVCDACGGSGSEAIAYTVFGQRIDDRAACSVCLGSGRISDRMPVSDAVADADTVWEMAHEVDPEKAINFCWLLLRAREYGHEAKGHMAYALALHATDFEQEIEWAGSQACVAARAAFRAVPGLREDESK